MMALVTSRSSAEMKEERKRQDDKGKSGKKSLTEDYIEQTMGADNDPLALADPTVEEAVPQIKPKNPVRHGVSPDGHAAVPGLLKPRARIGRG